MQKHKLSILITSLIFFISCSQDQSGKILMPQVSGNAFDVVVVMDPAKWESKPGDEIRRVLSTSIYGLPQEEPMFDIVNIPHSALDKVFKQQRNIIITKIDHKFPDKKVIVQNDLWANTQMIVNLIAPSDTAFENLLLKNEQHLLNLLNEIERQRFMEGFKKGRSNHIYNTVRKDFQLLLNVPAGYKIYKNEPDFMWIQHEYTDIQKKALVTMAVCIYQYPYIDENTFTKEYLIKARDSFMKKHLPGEVEGSYIGTEPEYPVQFDAYKLRKEKYTAEIRGLWKMYNGLAMGGPFVSISQVDEKYNRIVTVEGFAYAPGVNKRDLVRQLEAIIYSLDYPENSK